MADRSAETTLRRAGLRSTRQRLSIIEHLAGREGAVTAQQLHAELSETGHHVGLTTVYQTINALLSAGLLDAFDHGGEQTVRLCGDAHHHHLVCESCLRVEEIAAEAVERWVEDVAEHHRFSVTGHHADIFGLCASCAPADPSARTHPSASGNGRHDA